ncbi:MAG: hypothetical protein ACFFDN_40335, partial [Candidatus Hodarchaeota archaeon]
SRFVKYGGERRKSRSRNFITIFANLLIRLLFRTRIKDCTSGFRAFKKDLVKKLNLNNFFSIHYSITEEILYGCILNGAKIKEIPIIFYEREGGESKLDFKKIIYTFFGIFRIVLRGERIINARD